MSYRLLVSDVDGTLVDNEKRLAPATIAAVGRLTAAGIRFTIISARPRSGMMPIADALGLDGPMAAFNGGILFHRDGTVDEHHVIEPAVARGALDAARGAPVDIWVFADDLWHSSTDKGVHVEHERIASNQAPIVTTDFTALLDNADKITFVSDEPQVLQDLHALIDAGFAGQATVAQSQTYYLDVTALAANKGAGIEALAAAAGVPLAQVVAIGDQANDLPMLRRAGLAIAMGNAPAPVQAAAAHVTTANDADGVAKAIDTYLLPALEQIK
ncbi:Cof-type HAD-IIB family hydrolase [Sphingomonas sp.]|uniref:Cof-type HAD-IIB family hydrolase n=1 Tax=Sphingomonas sp. TaxID=28214 RepID=UPI003CC67A3F